MHAFARTGMTFTKKCVCFHPAHISAPLTHRNHIDMHLWMEIDEHFASTLNYRQSVKWVFHVMYPAAFRPRRFRGFADDVSTHTRARANTNTRLSLLCLHANSFRSRFVCERLRTFRIGRGRSWQHFASARGGFWWDVCTQHTCIIHSVSVRKQRVNKVPNERCAWTCDWMRREHTRLGFSGSRPINEHSLEANWLAHRLGFD